MQVCSRPLSLAKILVGLAGSFFVCIDEVFQRWERELLLNLTSIWNFEKIENL